MAEPKAILRSYASTTLWAPCDFLSARSKSRRSQDRNTVPGSCLQIHPFSLCHREGRIVTTPWQHILHSWSHRCGCQMQGGQLEAWACMLLQLPHDAKHIA